jgi:glycerophosphoryl diester phosphodiesterase
LAKRYGGDPIAEVQELVRLGADGLFGDYPDQIARGLRR